MLRRLRTILAHARAGHRIGCVRCECRDAAMGMFEFVSRRYDATGMRIVDEPSTARPHTLYVADPDELRWDGDL